MNGGRNAFEKRRSRDFGGKKGRSGCEPSVAVKRNKHKDRGNGTRNNKKKKRRRKTQRWRENPTHVFDAAAAASLPAAGRAARSRRMLCIRAGRAGRADCARLGLRGGRQRPRAPGRRPYRQRLHRDVFNAGVLTIELWPRECGTAIQLSGALERVLL